MRPRFSWALGLLLLSVAWAAGAASAGDRTLAVDDILRLHSAGVGEDIIISEIVVTGTVFDLDVDDILRLQEAGISERLLQFMIDTGREDTTAVDEESVAPDTTIESENEDDGEYEQAYVVEDYPPRLFVSLNWGYPSWWYGYYWRDYWYYDCAYYPWYFSWSPWCGAWYPSWYYGHCWAPAGWGYRYHWWSRNDPGWDPWWAWNRSDQVVQHPLSDHKYKVGTGSSGKVLYADAGLRTPDISRLTPDRKLVVRSRPQNLALDGGGKTGGDVRRHLQVAGEKQPADVDRGSGVRRPTRVAGDHSADHRGDVRRPVRPVRKPAPVDRPVHKVTRRTVASPKGSPVDVHRGGAPPSDRHEVRAPKTRSAPPTPPPAKVEAKQPRSEPAPRAPRSEVRGGGESRHTPPSGRASRPAPSPSSGAKQRAR